MLTYEDAPLSWNFRRLRERLLSSWSVLPACVGALVCMRVFVVSDYDVSTAVALIGAGSLGSLFVFMLMAILPTLLIFGSTLAMLYLVALVVEGSPVNSSQIVRALGGLIFTLLLVPVGRDLAVDMTVVLGALMLGILSRIVGRRTGLRNTMLGPLALLAFLISATVVIAGPLKAVFLDQSPWSQARLVTTTTKSVDGNERTSTLIAYVISTDGQDLVLLNDSPRRVVRLRAGDTTVFQDCSPSSGGEAMPMIPRFVESLTSKNANATQVHPCPR